MRKHLLIAIMIVLSASLLGASPPPLGRKAPDFVLRDQQDQPFHLEDGEGNMVLLLAADKEADAEMDRWRKMLVERYGGQVLMIGVADLRAVPFFMKKIARNRFKKDKARILLDWQGEVFTKYGLSEKIPNIVVVDKKSMLRHVCAGEAKQAAVDSLFREIDRWNQ